MLNRVWVMVVMALVWNLPLARAAQSEEPDDVDVSEVAFDEFAWDGTRVRRTDVDSIARTVSMTPEQKSSAMDLLAAYEAAIHAADKKLATLHESIGDTEDSETWKRLEPVYEKYHAHVKKLRETLLDDLKLTLNPAQLAEWPRVERRLRRQESMSQLMANGARSDLVMLAEKALAGGEMSPELKQVVDDYEMDIDRALGDAAKWREEQEKMWKDSAQQMESMSMEERVDFGKKIMREGMKRSRGVRDINMRYLKRVSVLLPERKRLSFEDDFYRRSFWALSHEDHRGSASSAGRTFDVLAKVDWIDEPRSAQIADIRKAYEAERRVMREKQVAAIIEAEDNPKDDSDSPYAYMGMDTEEMTRQWQRRRELEDSTVEKLRALFTDAELERMPPPLRRVQEIPDIDFDE